MLAKSSKFKVLVNGASTTKFVIGQLVMMGGRFLAVGSTAGLEAAGRGECDVAGIHLLDSKSGQYNRPFLTPTLDLVAGYGHQGLRDCAGGSRRWRG